MEQNISATRTVKDPVCGMDVVPGGARSWDYLYQEIAYHFCGPTCRSRFQADPKGVLLAGPGQPHAAIASPKAGEGKAWGSTLLEMIKKWRVRLF